MNCLIVPTIREHCIKEFLRAWRPIIECPIIVVEDMPEKTFTLDNDIIHVSWKEIREDLGNRDWIISKRDSAIRSYGFLLAYRLGCEYFFTLDDDCFPCEGHDFIRGHLQNLNNMPRWQSSVFHMRVRGLPYKNLGTLDNVVLNMGLWTGNPDLDGVQSLSQPAIDDFVPPMENHIVPANRYMPVCGMNLAFKRKVACLSYFPFMGQGSPYARFDDIWFGIILKRICDHLGLQISYGMPFVRHSRASNPFTNLVKEAPGIVANETFWETVHRSPLSGTSPETCFKEMADYLMSCEDRYLKDLGKRMLHWIEFFN